MGQESQALGRVAAIVENRIPDLSPIRVARLCDDPRAELAVLLRAYRTKPQREDLERRMEQAFALIEGAELPAVGSRTGAARTATAPCQSSGSRSLPEALDRSFL